MFRFAVCGLLCVSALAADSQQDFEQAQAYMEAGDIEGALDSFEEALRTEPDSLRYGSEYRQAVIQAEAYDRCLAFFEKLTATYPNAANAWLNYGLAHVDKIPAAGSVTKVILANAAAGHFSKALELETTWLGLYTRGSSYLYWPKVFDRAHLGVADLEQAYQIQKSEGRVRKLHARVYVALGDGYAKTEDFTKARLVWEEGLIEFPGHPGLQDRLALDHEAVAAYLYDELDPNKRVDTDLSPAWADDVE